MKNRSCLGNRLQTKTMMKQTIVVDTRESVSAMEANIMIIVIMPINCVCVCARIHGCMCTLKGEDIINEPVQYFETTNSGNCKPEF